MTGYSVGLEAKDLRGIAALVDYFNGPAGEEAGERNLDLELVARVGREEVGRVRYDGDVGVYLFFAAESRR